MEHDPDSKFYDMYLEIFDFIKQLQEKYGSGPKAAADSLMALCLTAARILSDEGLPIQIAESYLNSFTGFLDSLKEKKDLVGKGKN